MTTETTAGKRKSIALLPIELTALIKYRSGFRTEIECAVAIGVQRQVLNKVLLTGSGAPETIKKIKAALKPAQK